MPLGVKENEVVLRFRDKATKDRFIGQLSDGWGEGFVQFEWLNGANPDDVEVFVVNTFVNESNGNPNPDNSGWEEFWTETKVNEPEQEL